MQIKCKICGEMIDTKKAPDNGLNFNFATDSEDIFKAAMMSKELLTLVNHLMTEHPQEAMKMYASLVNSLYSAFEVSENEDCDMEL